MGHGLENEQEYDAERADRRSVLSRRGLIRLGGAAVGASALAGAQWPRAAQALEGPIVKPIPSDLFITRGTNAEMRWESLRGRGYVTPTDRFFIRNHTGTPIIDPTTWRLRIHGTGVAGVAGSGELVLSYDELLALPTVTVTRFVECAGNARSFFATQQGQSATGTPWGLGAIGVATWTGVPLSLVLERAGLKASALDVMPVGLDTQQVRRPIPIEKALAEDTLLVIGMNGETLPPDHGYPVRLLVPGWIGVANVKWVGSIEVSETPLASPWNTTSYRLFGPEYPDSPVLSTQVVKSALELPLPAELQAGPQWLTGRSWSAHAGIDRVDVSVDGDHWQPALLEKTDIARAWRQWSFRWNAKPGAHTVRVRARDALGNVQPVTTPFNQQGYLFGAIVSHPVAVS